MLEPPDDEVVRAGLVGWDDGAHADSEVEDAALLLLGDALGVEPVEGRAALPGLRVDHRAQPFGEDAHEVAGDTAARDVGEGVQIGAQAGAQGADLLEVEAGRREQEVGVEVRVADQRADEREPVRVDPRRAEADDHVALLAVLRPVDEILALDDADAGAGEVELLVAVDPGQLGGLAADERAAGGAADFRGTLDELGDELRLDLVRGDVVEEEERLRAAGRDVVDAVRGEVGAGPLQLSRSALEHELRPDAVGRGGEDAVLVEREQAGEAAEGADRARSLRRGDGGREASDDRVGGVERDPGRLVGLLAHRAILAGARAAKV